MLRPAHLLPWLSSDVFQRLKATSGGSNQAQGVAILPAQAYQVPQSYREQVSTKFGVSVEGLMFTDPPEAKRALNRWAQSQTGSLDQEVVSSLDSGLELLLATVASYQSKFQVAHSQLGFFSVIDEDQPLFFSLLLQPASVSLSTPLTPRTSVS